MRAIMVVTLAAAAPAACQTFVNPAFESAFEGWTVRNTSNGLGAPGTVTPPTSTVLARLPYLPPRAFQSARRSTSRPMNRALRSFRRWASRRA